MDWNNETLESLSEIFGKKAREINGDFLVLESDEAWISYISGLGLRMGSYPATDHFKPCLFISDGTRMVRIVNAWRTRCIDMPEEFAIRALVVGFLP